MKIITRTLLCLSTALFSTAMASAPWPPIKTATIFKTKLSLFTVVDNNIQPAQNTIAETLADSSRNMALLHTVLQVPYFGSVNIDVQLDFNKGTTVGYIPLFGFC